MISSERILEQLDGLLARYRKATESYPEDMPFGRVKEFLTSARASIERLAPPGSPYLASCSEAIDKAHIHDETRLEWLMGVVEALRQDYAAGALTPLQELIRAEVFDDFLEMAQHLLELGYR